MGVLRFQGKVVVATGQLPWDPIPVVVTCGDVTRYNTQTDPKGGFQIIAAPRASEVTPGKSDPKMQDPSHLIGCTVHAVLGGFQSSTVTIANRSIVDDTDIGTITLQRDEKTPGAVVSATTASAPKDALKEFDKARSGLQQPSSPDSAEHELEKAVPYLSTICRSVVSTWGKLQEAQKPQDAWDSYSKGYSR